MKKSMFGSQQIRLSSNIPIPSLYLISYLAALLGLSSLASRYAPDSKESKERVYLITNKLQTKGLKTIESS
jgi:hypothetical protein